MILKEFILIIVLLVIVNLLYQILNGELVLLSAFLIVSFFVVSFFEKEIGLNIFQKDNKTDSITALEVIHDSLDEFKNNQAQIVSETNDFSQYATPAVAVSSVTPAAVPAEEKIYLFKLHKDNITASNNLIKNNIKMISVTHSFFNTLKDKMRITLYPDKHNKYNAFKYVNYYYIYREPNGFTFKDEYFFLNPQNNFTSELLIAQLKLIK